MGLFSNNFKHCEPGRFQVIYKSDNRMCLKIKVYGFIVALMSAVLFSPMASALALKDIAFASLPGGKTEVTLKFDGVPPAPKGYTIEKPARISLDLDGVKNETTAKYHNLGNGNAQSLTVIGAKDRTRLIFNLVDLVPYTTSVKGDEMIVRLGEAHVSPVMDTSSEGTINDLPANSSQSKSSASKGVSVTSIDFRRGEKGDGQVLVTLSDPKVNIDMTEEGGYIKLRLPNVKLPENLRRRLDVTDFATPVVRVDATTENGGTLITIKPQGEYDYLAYQTDNQYTVSVEKITADEAAKRQKDKFPYTGEKLSLNFQDIEVRSVLQLIADFTGLNLVASDTVRGRITLRLQNVPWDQALDLVLKTKGLDKRKIGNVLLVAPADEIAAREKLELQTSKQVAELAPVKLEIIQVNYAKAKDIVKLLKADKELISSRGFISSDERTNTISVRETAEKREQIRRLIATWDIPVRQVLIEARIVKARTNVTDDMGIQWGGGGLKRKGSSLFRVGGSNNTLTELSNVAAGTASTITFPDALNVDLGVTKANTSSIALGYSKDNFLINLELSALQADGKGEIVAQPKVVTSDRQTATIESGEEIPYQEASSSGATSISFKKAVLSLKVTPQITPDDKIIMDLEVNQDNRGVVTAGVPSIETNQVKTQVLVGNGETVVLGGIYQTDVSKTVTKTPFLGDIPYLGRLFKKEENSDQRTELLIFITPKLMKNGIVE
jgi:type IV pilus assembly protein PilQ